MTKYVQAAVSNIIQDGHSPTPDEWANILRQDKLKRVLRQENKLKQIAIKTAAVRLSVAGIDVYPKGSLTNAEAKAIGAQPVEGTDIMVAPTRYVSSAEASLKHASLTGGLLNWLSTHAPNVLSGLVAVKPPWLGLINFIDPLANFDPATTQAVLSPIGLVHLYREYFFEFETFLGSPVGHVWISPGGTVAK